MVVNRDGGKGQYAEMKTVWRSQLRVTLLNQASNPLTTFCRRSSNSSSSTLLAFRGTLSFHFHFHSHSHSLFPSPVPLNFSSTILVPVRCLSSIFPANAPEKDEPVQCSVEGDADGEGRSLREEDSMVSIPVKAYFFSTRFVLDWFRFLFLVLFFGLDCLFAEKPWEKEGIGAMLLFHGLVLYKMNNVVVDVGIVSPFLSSVMCFKEKYSKLRRASLEEFLGSYNRLFQLLIEVIG